MKSGPQCIHVTARPHFRRGQTKLARNRARDRFVTRTLRAQGWQVLRIWEHELVNKNEKRLAARLRRAGLLLPPKVSPNR